MRVVPKTFAFRVTDDMSHDAMNIVVYDGIMLNIQCTPVCTIAFQCFSTLFNLFHYIILYLLKLVSCVIYIYIYTL